MNRPPVIALFCGFLVIIARPADAQDRGDAKVLDAWLNAQTNIQTWEADFTQIRSLQSLTQPLTSSGHVWFQAPNRFRWEVTRPLPTIAVRQPAQLLVIYPRLKRVERYSLDSSNAGPWRDTLALLDAGFPRSRSDIESRFDILSLLATNSFQALALRPKSDAARRFMPRITIGFDPATLALHSTELTFTDGSTMQNIFTNAVMNPKIDSTVFDPALGADYKTVEPFAKP